MVEPLSEASGNGGNQQHDSFAQAAADIINASRRDQESAPDFDATTAQRLDREELNRRVNEWNDQLGAFLATRENPHEFSLPGANPAGEPVSYMVSPQTHEGGYMVREITEKEAPPNPNQPLPVPPSVAHLAGRLQAEWMPMEKAPPGPGKQERVYQWGRGKAEYVLTDFYPSLPLHDPNAAAIHPAPPNTTIPAEKIDTLIARLQAAQHDEVR